MSINTPASSMSTPENIRDEYEAPEAPQTAVGTEGRLSSRSTTDSVSPPDTETGQEVSTYDKQALIDKLQLIPTEKLREIITSQIDLEIRLKHKELSMTEDEIGKCEAQMITLRNFFQVPTSTTFREEPSDFTAKYCDLLGKALAVNYQSLKNGSFSDASASSSMGQMLTEDQMQLLQQQRDQQYAQNQGYGLEQGHSYRTRSTTSSLRPSFSSVGGGLFSGRPTTVGCLYRRTDGIIVKLTCPDCQRSNFSLAQGFLNHSRIAHSKEYTSQDAAALKCGTILSHNEQDEEGLSSLASLKQKNLDPTKNLNINEIYFDGLSASLNTVHRVGPEKEVSPLGSVGNAPATAPDTRKAAQSELMKKLIKGGVALNEKAYESMIADAKEKVKDPHLFEDEEDGSDSTSVLTPAPAPGAVPEAEDIPKIKRRKSRGGVGLTQRPIEGPKNEEVLVEQGEDLGAGPTAGTRSKTDLKRRKR